MESKSEKLARELRASRGRENAVSATLSTNERVIARVTDGIYREPGSAIRELISNAYDADASRVTIKTDAPRFGRIRVDDDGVGMSPESLSHLLKNIGGSAKRTETGRGLGMTQDDDLSKSPGGRRLIGKLGIGMFSVSQLTKSFQIITKRQGDDFRSIATVRLNQFSDNQSEESSTGEFEAGQVRVWTESASDLLEHGTSIVLTSVRPRTRESLRSTDIWDAVDAPDHEDLNGARFIPRYHIGRVDENNEFRDKETKDLQSLPWSVDDSPADAFGKMVDAAWASAVTGNPNPKLSDLFDNYLKMLWDLSLALPVDYYRGHLFDRSIDPEYAEFYKLSNESAGHAVQIAASEGSLREAVGLESGLEREDFRVFIDRVELKRPIRYDDLPTTDHALTRPLVFVGKMRESFEGFPVKISAGPLSFEAYLFWNPKIAPVDHRGALVRIHGASGSLFDETFFKYQVSEQTRLRQITCEIFVSEGLEAALNIDREAFNVAHPHMVVLTKWVHGALRQLATTQKGVARRVRSAARAEESDVTRSKLTEVVELANHDHTRGEGDIPKVFFTVPEKAANLARFPGLGRPDAQERVAYAFPAEKTLGVSSLADARAFSADLLDKTKAIVQILSIYGVLENLAPAEQESLVRSLANVLRGENV